MQQRLTPDSKPPQAEPEIYPPGATILREGIWASTGTHGTQRIYIARLGPVGPVFLALTIGAVLVVGLFLLLGVALISVAVGAALAIGAIISAVVRGRFRRFR